jgi:hypothetical protein
MLRTSIVGARTLAGGLVFGVLIAGCGSSASTSGNQTITESNNPATTGTGTSTGTGTGTGTGAGGGKTSGTGQGGSTTSTGHGGGSTGAGGGGGATTTSGSGGGSGGSGPGPCAKAADCDDGDACTDDTCNAGACAHAAIALDDGDACTSDTCDAKTGVHHQAIDPNDNDVCTVDACDPKAGVTHAAVDVDDHDACTKDSCDPVTGPAHVAVDTDDKNVCTLDWCDPATGVRNDPIDIDDANACTVDACDPITGPSHTPVNPDDQNACTDDSCDPVLGVQHAATNCDDGNVCTDDACKPATGCVHSPNANACSDGDACTQNDYCQAGSCLAGAPVVCAQQDGCHAIGVCDKGTGVCSNPVLPDGTACDDGNPNNVGDACKAGVCAGVTCLAGQFHCACNQVMKCNPGPNAAWVPMSPDLTCNPALNQKCDEATGTCKTLTPIGGVAATGSYYQYGVFKTGSSAFLGGYDVDAYGDYIYVNRGSTNLDVYKITLQDTDGDGILEPNQHPNNPKAQGPMEVRTLTFVTTYTKANDLAPLGSASAAEIFATNDGIFSLGPTRNGDITQWLFATKQNTVAIHPLTTLALSHIGFGAWDGKWYGSNESARRVYSYCDEKKIWVPEFMYPDLAGSHMDGLEVVQSIANATQYVYVSDMTSDYLGQYRRDGKGGWVQENLFQYADVTGSSVEGMGFGALNHFWITGGSTLIEIGGGDLANYTP